jgi:hypothetical protein
MPSPELHVRKLSRPESATFFNENRQLARMSHHRPADYLLLPPDIHLPRLDQIIYKTTSSFEQEVQQIKRGEKREKDMRQYVLFVEGTPGSGKTTLVNNLLHPYLKAFTKRMETQYGITVPVFLQRFDDIAEAHQAAGRIETPLDEPFTDMELQPVGRSQAEIVALDLEYAAKNSPYAITIVEKNAGTSVKVGDTWTQETRAYYSSMFDHMVGRKRPFQNIQRDKLYAVDILLTGGPAMEILADRREDLNTMTLEEARADNLRLGLPPFQTLDDLLAAQGAGRKLLRLAHARTDINILRPRRDMKNAGERIQALLPDFMVEMFRGFSRPANLDKQPFGLELWKQCEALAPLIHRTPLKLFWSSCRRLGEAGLHWFNLQQIDADDKTVLVINPFPDLQKQPSSSSAKMNS